MNFICYCGLEYPDCLMKERSECLAVFFWWWFYFRLCVCVCVCVCVCGVQEWGEISLREKNHPQILLSNTKQLWKLVFASDLIILMNLTIIVRQNSVYMWNSHNSKVILTTNILESQVISCCFIHFLHCQKLKWEARSPFPHKL